jgi:hypothetical protein
MNGQTTKAAHLSGNHGSRSVHRRTREGQHFRFQLLKGW